jgi:hypothetical protein
MKKALVFALTLLLLCSFALAADGKPVSYKSGTKPSKAFSIPLQGRARSRR